MSRIEIIDSNAELWKPVPEFEGRYEVSNIGRVRTFLIPGRPGEWLQVPKLLRIGLGTNGRPMVSLCNGKKQTSRTVYKLVMEAFVGPRPSGMDIAHLNGNCRDSRLTNLKYCTRVENAYHKRLHGTHLEAEDHPNAILSNEAVEVIIRLIELGIPQARIARCFEVGAGVINCIAKGHCYSAVTKKPKGEKKS